VPGLAGPAPFVGAAELPLLSGPDLPIGFFWPPPQPFTTSERYAEIAEAGFTWVLGVNDIVDFPVNDTMLRLCEEHGLYGVPTDFRIYGIRDYPRDQWRQIFIDTLAEYRPYPAFAGLHLKDEPTEEWYPSMAEVFRLGRELAPDVLFHTNAAPWHTGDALRELIEVLSPPMVSFDNYPFRRTGDNLGFLEQWGEVRAAGLTYDLPTWVYVQSFTSTNYRRPTPEELLWQINVSLAFGCKGIQYFTYWTPEVYAEFGPGLITLDGQRTDLYYAAKDINNNWLARVGRQLKPLRPEVLGIANLLDFPPPGLPAFAPDEYVAESWGDPVILSQFSKPDEPNYRWLLVVNYSYKEPCRVRVNLGRRVRGRGIAVFDPSTERYVEVPPPRKRLDIRLDTAAAALYRLPVRAEKERTSR